jgi:trigger factor
LAAGQDAPKPETQEPAAEKPDVQAAKDGEAESGDDIDVTYDVEDIGPCYKGFKVTVLKGDANKRFQETFSEFQDEATVPGFRKGRVPRWLLERKFGKQLRAEIAARLAEAGMKKAITKAGVDPIGMPEFQAEQMVFEPEKDFQFEFKVYVRPEFEVSDYLGLELVVPDLEEAEEGVDRVVRQTFRSEAKLTDAPADAVAEAEDLAICDASLVLDGNTVWLQQNLNLLLTDRTRSQIMLPHLVDVAIGSKVGEEKSQTITVPVSYHTEEHRGKEATLRLKITQLKKPVYPELTDELAQKRGFDDLGELRDKVREQLEDTNRRLTEMLVHEQIRQKLLDLAKFELPAALIEKHTESRTQRRRAELEAQGVSESEILKDLAAFRKTSTDDLIREMRLIFIMRQICKKEDIKLEEGDVDDRIAEIAKETGGDPFDLREEYEKSGRLDILRDQLLQEKTFELIEKHAVLRKVSKEEQQEMAQAGKDAEGKPGEAAAPEQAGASPGAES